MTVRPIVQGVVRGIVQGISGGNGGFNPLVFHALDDVGGSFTADVITGVGSLTEARTSTNYAPNASGVWTSYTSGQVIQEYANGKWWVKGEPAHTNSQIYSNDLTSAEWTASNVTVAKDAVGLTGAANSACTLTATSANGTVIANAITAASATHVTRWFIKRKTGTGTVELTLDNGSTWNDITAALDAASGWYYEPTAQAALTDPRIGIRIVTSGDAVEVGNAECHLATTIAAVRGSSPIYTNSAPVSTVATDLRFDLANHSDERAGWYCEYTPMWNTSEGSVVQGILSANLNAPQSVLYTQFGNRTISYDGTTTALKTGLTFVAGSAYKLATIYDSSNSQIVLNADGSYGTPAAYDGNYVQNTAIKIGVGIYSPMLIRNIKRWNADYATAQSLIDTEMSS